MRLHNQQYRKSFVYGVRQLDDAAHEEGKQDPLETAEAADTFASTLPLFPKGLSLRNARGDEIEDY